jgi:hypothetical protein
MADKDYYYTMHVTFRAKNDEEARAMVKAAAVQPWLASYHTHLTDGDDWAEGVTETCDACGRATHEGMRYGGRRWCLEDGRERDTYQRPTADALDEMYPWYSDMGVTEGAPDEG